MKLNSLEDLFIDKLNDLYTTEKRNFEVLQKMVDASNTTLLKEALNVHIEQTKNQLVRLDDIFKKMHLKPLDKKNTVINALIQKSIDQIEQSANSTICDTAIVVNEQAIKHYEISCYSSAEMLAKMLKYQELSAELHKTLEEESSTDTILSEISEKIYSSEVITKKAA